MLTRFLFALKDTTKKKVSEGLTQCLNLSVINAGDLQTRTLNLHIDFL